MTGCHFSKRERTPLSDGTRTWPSMRKDNVIGLRSTHLPFSPSPSLSRSLSHPFFIPRDIIPLQNSEIEPMTYCTYVSRLSSITLFSSPSVQCLSKQLLSYNERSTFFLSAPIVAFHWQNSKFIPHLEIDRPPLPRFSISFVSSSKICQSFRMQRDT